MADGVSSILAAGLLVFAFPGRRAAAPAVHSAAKVRAGSPLRDRPVMAMLGMMFLLAIVTFQITSTFPLTLRDLYHFSEARIGVTLAVNTLIIVLFEMVLVHSLARRDPLKVVGVGGFLFCAGMALLPFGSSFGYVVFTVAIWTMGEMLAFPLLGRRRGRPGAGGDPRRLHGAVQLLLRGRLRGGAAGGHLGLPAPGSAGALARLRRRGAARLGGVPRVAVAIAAAAARDEDLRDASDSGRCRPAALRPCCLSRRLLVQPELAVARGSSRPAAAPPPRARRSPPPRRRRWCASRPGSAHGCGSRARRGRPAGSARRSRPCVQLPSAKRSSSLTQAKRFDSSDWSSPRMFTAKTASGSSSSG